MLSILLYSLSCPLLLQDLSSVRFVLLILVLGVNVGASWPLVTSVDKKLFTTCVSVRSLVL